MKSPVKFLLVAAGIFGLIGSLMGAHMAGSGSYALRPIHAHILVVGWLCLFSWAVFYQTFNVKYNGLAKFHVWTAVIGTTGLVLGMFVNNVASLGLPDVVTLILYIGGGTTLLLSFITFFIQTILYKAEK
jgi:hypothetical protein